jgi:hypothetical protein
MTPEVMPGSDRRNKQPMGLVVVAIEVQTRRLRPEALARGLLSGERYEFASCDFPQAVYRSTLFQRSECRGCDNRGEIMHCSTFRKPFAVIFPETLC